MIEAIIGVIAVVLWFVGFLNAFFIRWWMGLLLLLIFPAGAVHGLILVVSGGKVNIAERLVGD
jgi:hypothetical protein